jgi:hypothetical protein
MPDASAKRAGVLDLRTPANAPTVNPDRPNSMLARYFFRRSRDTVLGTAQKLSTY